MSDLIDPDTSDIVKLSEPNNLPISNLTAALAEAMSEMEPIRKHGFNPHFKYHFTRMEDLLNEVTPKLAKHGLLIMQSEAAREIADGMLYATFEFTILHKSGETWPDKPRMTGMARIADNKGSKDDKAMNKCHTAARKFFLMALFQIPSEDDEPDDAAKDGQTGGRADQPKISERATAGGPPRTPPPPEFPHGTKPRRIEPVRGETPQSWAEKYIKAVLSSETINDVAAWRIANDSLIELLAEKAADMLVRTVEAERSRKKLISANDIIDTGRPASGQRPEPTAPRPTPTPPAPAPGPRSSMNAEEFREQLDRVWSDIHVIKDLDDSWRNLVEPVQGEMFPPDLADLSHLWGLHAKRIEENM